jgi:hypothetical protein
MNTICILAILCIKLIPVDYHSYYKLYQHFILSDSIIWWEAGWCDLNPKHPKPYVIFCSDTSKSIQLPILTDRNTFSSNYYHSFLNREFVFYVTNSGRTKFIKKVEDLPAFIGAVDNLEEALFLANIYGYGSLNGKKYGSYKFENGSYTLNLYKIVDPPDVIMAGQKPLKAKIRVSTNGDVFEIIGSETRRLSVIDMYRSL